jgi:hypothetical protein
VGGAGGGVFAGAGVVGAQATNTSPMTNTAMAMNSGVRFIAIFSLSEFDFRFCVTTENQSGLIVTPMTLSNPIEFKPYLKSVVDRGPIHNRVA